MTARSARPADIVGIRKLVQRADLARVRGTGFVFSQMLRDLYVVDVKILADHKPATLYGRLRRYNRDTEAHSRAPTASEVTDWIEQARNLPKLVTYGPGDREEPRSGAHLIRLRELE